MLIQTFRGEILSIELGDQKYFCEDLVTLIKEKIAEIEPAYTPFSQFLFPLRNGPLRPIHEEEMLGMVQQRIRIQVLKPQFRIILSQERDCMDHFVWLVGVRWTRKKGMAKRIQKDVFLYDPLLDRYTLHCGFSSHFHRFKPSYTFLIPRTESIEWYSSVEEAMRVFHALFPSTPCSDTDRETLIARWERRKKCILEEHANAMNNFHKKMGMFRVDADSFISYNSFSRF